MRLLQAEERSVELADGARVDYRTCGRGLPVLLANGLGAPSVAWHALIDHFRDRYRFVYWDYRGLGVGAGAGAAAGRSVEDHANDAQAIVTAEQLERFAVVGWSMGVQVALELFRRAPQRVASLVLISGSARAIWGDAGGGGIAGAVLHRGLRVLQRSPRMLAAALRAGLKSPEAFAWARRLGILGDGVDAELFTRVTRELLRTDVAAYLQTLARLSEYDARPWLAQVDVPTLVIAGDRDPFTSRAAVEHLVHEVAGAEYLPLPGATHFALLDAAPRVHLRVEKFWNERGYRGEARPSLRPSA